MGEITLGTPTGRSVAGTVHSVWTLPTAVALDRLATAGQSVSDVLANITTPASAKGPTVGLQVQTAAPVVGELVEVAVTASSAAGHKVQARVTFYGAAPRWELHAKTLLVCLQCLTCVWPYGHLWHLLVMPSAAGCMCCACWLQGLLFTKLWDCQHNSAQ